MNIHELPGEIQHHGDMVFVHVFEPPREMWSNVTRMRFDAFREDIRDELTPKYQRLVDQGTLAPEEAEAELMCEIYKTLARELRLTYLRYYQR